MPSTSPLPSLTVLSSPRCRALELRFAVVALLALLGGAAPSARAQTCEGLFPPTPSDPGAAEVPIASGIFVVTPASLGEALPRNTVLQLGGALEEVAAGFWQIDVTVDDAPLSYTLDGARFLPGTDDGLWPANVLLGVDIQPSPTNPCPDCFGRTSWRFSINDVVDTTPPALTELDVRGYVMPSLEEQQACGFFVGTHALDVRVTTDETAALTVGARTHSVEPLVLLRNSVAAGGVEQLLNLSLGSSVPVAIGEAVVVVVTAVDVAGNVSAPILVRTRLRSVADRSDPTLPSYTCTLSSAGDVHDASAWSTTPAFRVLFPFEELPLVLRPRDAADDSADIALVPGVDVEEDARAGHMFTTASAVPPGDYVLQSLACAQCTCASCNAAIAAPVTIRDVVDEAAPAAPQIITITDDPSPPLSVDVCVADDAATVVVLAPAEDDVSGAADLVYDAVIELDGDLPRPAGRGVTATVRDDGNLSVRLPTAPLGRVVGAPFVLTLTARDAAGRTAQTRYESVVDVADAGCAGCGADGDGAGAALVGGGAVVLLRRRRR